MTVAKYIRTPYNYKHSSSDIELVNKANKSLTEPDMNLTVREILTRFTTGNLPAISHNPQFADGEITFEDYLNVHDLDYDLADATRDKIRLMEIKAEVDASINLKKLAKENILKQEKLEFEEFKKIKAEAAKMEKAQKETKTQ